MELQIWLLHERERKHLHFYCDAISNFYQADRIQKKKKKKKSFKAEPCLINSEQNEKNTLLKHDESCGNQLRLGFLADNVVNACGCIFVFVTIEKKSRERTGKC